MEILLLLLFVPLLFVGLFDGDDDDDEGPGPDIVGTDGPERLEGTTRSEEFLAGAGDDDVTAWDGDDTVNADEGSDLVLGEAGNDLVFGGAGNDLVDGGSGNDTIWMGDGDDMIADDGMSPGPEFDTGPGGDDQISGGSGNDMILDWQGANTLTGELGNDFLFAPDDPGTDAADSLSGGWGVDTLWGDDGDTLTGGGFADGFDVMVDETDAAAVTITDFDAATETLYIDIDQDTFAPATGNDLVMEVDPASGDVVLSLSGQPLVVLTAPTGGFSLGNVTLPEWMRPVA